ncbi:hypothetical protein BDW62DRAFT_201819 [Aspergillus aurantiobrunneus]
MPHVAQTDSSTRPDVAVGQWQHADNIKSQLMAKLPASERSMSTYLLGSANSCTYASTWAGLSSYIMPHHHDDYCIKPTVITMRFQMHQIDPSTPEFTDIVACEITSFNNPYQSIFRFFYPIFGPESDEEKAPAFESLVQLHRQWAREDPDSIWLKAIDTENNNKIVGGLLLKIHKSNPFAPAKAKADSAVWYPPGSKREYIDECLRIFNGPREKFMQRPHLYSYIGFVLPEYRRLGVADLALDEECRRADEHGLEAYMEAVTAMGVPIFMRHGFIPYRKVSVKPEREDPDDEWKEMERRMQPLRFWPMWRPPYGRFIPGETVPPWDGQMIGMFSKL